MAIKIRNVIKALPSAPLLPTSLDGTFVRALWSQLTQILATSNLIIDSVYQLFGVVSKHDDNIISLKETVGEVANGSSQVVWTEAILNAPWKVYNATTFDTPGFYKDRYGIVRLKGMVKGGTVGSIIFTLPEGFRPEIGKCLVTLTSDDTNNIVGGITIKSDGAVTLLSGGTVWVSLDSVAFATR